MMGRLVASLGSLGESLAFEGTLGEDVDATFGSVLEMPHATDGAAEGRMPWYS